MDTPITLSHIFKFIGVLFLGLFIFMALKSGYDFIYRKGYDSGKDVWYQEGRESGKKYGMAMQKYHDTCSKAKEEKSAEMEVKHRTEYAMANPGKNIYYLNDVFGHEYQEYGCPNL